VLNDTYTIHDLEAAQRALHGQTVSPGCSPLPVEVRVAETIARARDDASRRAADQPQLSEKDRADMREELGNLVLYIDLDAKLARAQQRYVRAAELDLRASRVRHFITLLAAFCLLVLGGCLEGWTIPPPPHDVYLVEVPDEDVRHWETAINGWNSAVEREPVLVLVREKPAGRCGVYVRVTDDLPDDTLAETEWGDECVIPIEYARGAALSTAGHELGHALGLGHRPDTVMAEAGSPFVLPSHKDGADVRRRWGIP